MNVIKHPGGYVSLKYLIDISNIQQNNSPNIPYNYFITLNFIGGEKRNLYYKKLKDAEKELLQILKSIEKNVP